jgi:hypothetical protein
MGIPSSTFNPEDFDLRKHGYQIPEIPETKIETETIKKRRDKRFIPPIPERVFRKLVKLARRTWAVYLLIWRRAKMTRNKSVNVTNKLVEEFGLSRKEKYHALRVLKRVGLLRIERPKHKRCNPTVTLTEDAQ